jgi:two-component system, NarL family, nitrate/nitrite response regulator NarL
MTPMGFSMLGDYIVCTLRMVQTMIRVLVVTPTRLISDLIRAVCDKESQLKIVGAVRGPKEAMEHKENCDVMVVGTGLSHQEILSLVTTLGQNSNNPPVVVVGLADSPALVVRFLEAGAASCVREQDSASQLVTSIRLAAVRQTVLASDLCPVVIERISSLAQTSIGSQNVLNQTKRLTRREREILKLIAEGFGNRAIARHLTIELGTTKNHVHNILDKLNVKSRKEAAIISTLGLIS